jgi:hypothetical protein
MKKIALIAMLLTGCATTQVTPEMQKLAEQRKGETRWINVAMEASDNFSRVCGHVKPNESVACSQGILRRKIVKQAEAYCVYYRIGDISWQGTSGGLFNTSTAASANVKCLGLNSAT